MDELVRLYEQWRTAALWRREKCRDDLTANPVPQDLASLFAPGSEAHKTLRFKGRPRVPRLAPLIYLNLLFHSFHNPDGDLDRANVYRQNFLDTNVAEIPANETIMWGLVTNTRDKTLMDLPLIECTIRMLGTSRILDSSENEHLADTLCDFLGVRAEGDVVGADRWWSPQELDQALKRRCPRGLGDL